MELGAGRGWWSTFRLSTYCGWQAGLGAAVVAVTPEARAIPFSAGNFAEPWALLLGLGSVAAAALCQQEGRELTAPLARPPWVPRAYAAAVGSVVLLVVAALACVAIDRPVGIGVRNAALMLALALVTASLLGADLAWTPPLVVVGITWLYGRDDSNAPYGWAVLEQGASSLLLGTSLVLLALAVTLWSRTGSRNRAGTRG